MSVVITMNAEDFERLCDNMSTVYTDVEPDRFLDAGSNEPVDLDLWKYIYWLDNYANVILARAFLNAYGELFQLAVDEGGGGWVIFTDYASPVQARAAKEG